MRFDIFLVYKHTFKDGKVYIGITKNNAKTRWQNGKGYKQNIRMFKAIEKEGWDNIQHEILADNLYVDEAEQMEQQLIKKYKSNFSEYGYNIDIGGKYYGCTAEFRLQSAIQKAKCQHEAERNEFVFDWAVRMFSELSDIADAMYEYDNESAETKIKKIDEIIRKYCEFEEKDAHEQEFCALMYDNINRNINTYNISRINIRETA